MKPVVCCIVLEPDAAAALFMRETSGESLPPPAATISAVAQRLVESQAKDALSALTEHPRALEAAREAFQTAHASLPSPDRSPEALIVVNLPLERQTYQASPRLILAEDAEL